MDFMLQLNKNITFATQNLCSKQEVNELGDSVKQLIQTQVSMIKQNMALDVTALKDTLSHVD